MTDPAEPIAAVDENAAESSSNFIEDIIKEDLASGKHTLIHTRFPPEPNGYLHIGHAKAICFNFGVAQRYGGLCNLRLDDTNPVKEDVEYVDNIMADIHWLGFDWGDRKFYASDYYQRLYEFAVELIKKGKAYVCDQSPEELAAWRGDFHTPGRESPWRNRSVEENLDLFERMKNGEFEEGTHVLRAKIDMQSPNMNMRDPTIYRIRKVTHHRTGDKWCIYPMYDFAHELSDALEGITHSLCSIEFENHRPLYEWVLNQLDVPCKPRQIEFARLEMTYTVMSKRKLLDLVQEGAVSGWDDPRMPTLSGLRRRGYTPESIRNFCDRIGMAKRPQVIDVALLEHAVREDLNDRAPRVMGVVDPIKVVITNFPEGQVEWFDAPLHPEKPEMGSRKLPFSRELYVERDDFRSEAPKKWYRLAPGMEVRLRYACLITCNEAIYDDKGNVVELHCTWDPESKGGDAKDGRRVRGTLHWVSAQHAVDAEVRTYDRLFKDPCPGRNHDFHEDLNPNSLNVTTGAKLEPMLADAKPGDHFQFERLGYYCVDTDSTPEHLVFNLTVPLKDSWAKIESDKADKPAPIVKGQKKKEREAQSLRDKAARQNS